MEIKIGIQHIGREVSVESDKSADDVKSDVAAALENDGLLELHDSRGRKVLIPAARIAYVEIGEENARKVGFGAV